MKLSLGQIVASESCQLLKLFQLEAAGYKLKQLSLNFFLRLDLTYTFPRVHYLAW